MNGIGEPPLKHVKIFLLPGGIMPKRQSDGAVGFDVAARVVVSPFEMDVTCPHLRKTLFDFTTRPADRKTRRCVQEEHGTLRYVLRPGEKVLIGIGFITELAFPWFYWLTPRSGLATKHFVQVTNAPGTVDPDYRGEAAACIHNYGKKNFHIHHGMRIAQIIFTKASIPTFQEITDYYDFTKTDRGAGGFGSTGV